MKKRFALLLVFAMLLAVGVGAQGPAGSEPAAPAAELPSAHLMDVGNYFTLGQYGGKPITWRYVADDEHGKLVTSDKVLCYKPFGPNNFWEESFLREWLNSDEAVCNIKWGSGSSLNLPSSHIPAENETPGLQNYEKGFLHGTNFTKSERRVMKPVTQWTMLPEDHLDLSTNGVDTPYDGQKDFIFDNPRDGGGPRYYSISELPETYHGAAYETTDTVFLLDEMQVYHIWENFGTAETSDPFAYYFLRTPTAQGNYTVEQIIIIGLSNYMSSRISYPNGVRPAFYLDADNAVILSGNGTVDDPYVLDGKPESDDSDNIQVFCDDKEVLFDVPPIIENDRTLVPFRAIFETLGAVVDWDGASQTVTGALNGSTVSLVIGSSTAYVNGQSTMLDVPPKILNNRTLVPLRFIAENLGFGVEWNDADMRIDIHSTKQTL